MSACGHDDWQRYAGIDGTVRCAGCDTDALRPTKHPYTSSKVVSGECPVCHGRHLTVYGALVEHLDVDGARCSGSGGNDAWSIGVAEHYRKCAAENRDSGD